MSKIAGALRALEVCEETLKLREQFIAEQKLAPVPLEAWWQDPQVIVAGLVFSVSVGVTAGLIFAHRGF